MIEIYRGTFRITGLRARDCIAMVGIALHEHDSSKMVLAKVALVGKLRADGHVVAHGVRLIEVVLADSKGGHFGDLVGGGAVGVELETLQIVAVEGVIEVVGEVDTGFEPFEEAYFKSTEVVLEVRAELGHPPVFGLVTAVERSQRSVGIDSGVIAQRQSFVFAREDRDSVAGLAQRGELSLPGAAA